MIRLAVTLLMIYIGYRVVRALLTGSAKPSPPSRGGSASETHRDPVCGTYVSEEDAVIGRLNGERHFFCSMNCLEKFREQLEQTTP